MILLNDMLKQNTDKKGIKKQRLFIQDFSKKNRLPFIMALFQNPEF